MFLLIVCPGIAPSPKRAQVLWVPPTAETTGQSNISDVDIQKHSSQKKVPARKSFQTNSYVWRRKNYQFTPYLFSRESMSPAQITRLADPTPPEGLKGPSARRHQPTWAEPSPHNPTHPIALRYADPQKPTRPSAALTPALHISPDQRYASPRQPHTSYSPALR